MLLFRVPSFIPSPISFIYDTNYNKLVSNDNNSHIIHKKNDEDIFNTYRKYTHPYDYMKSVVDDTKINSKSYSIWEIICHFNVIDDTLSTIHMVDRMDGIQTLIQSKYKDSISSLLDYDIEIFSHISPDDQSDSSNRFIEWRSSRMDTSDMIILNPKYITNQNMITNLFISIILQKPGGTLILHMNDIGSVFSIDIIYIITSLYEDVFIVKPEISDIHEYETFIFCYGMKDFSKMELTTNMIPLLGKCYTRDSRLIHNYIPHKMITSILNASSICENIRSSSIIETLKIQHNILNLNIESIEKRNISKCKRWCNKHHIKYT